VTRWITSATRASVHRSLSNPAATAPRKHPYFRRSWVLLQQEDEQFAGLYIPSLGVQHRAQPAASNRRPRWSEADSRREPAGSQIMAGTRQRSPTPVGKEAAP
jgi:hypothetical protein